MSASKLGDSLVHIINSSNSNEGDQATGDLHETDLKEPTFEDRVDDQAEDVVPVEAGQSPKIKQKTPKPSKGNNLLLVPTLVIASLAILLSGYTFISQKSQLINSKRNFDDLNISVGQLNTKTDELGADVSGVKKDVQSHSSQLDKVNNIEIELSNLQKSVNSLRSDIDDLQAGLNSQKKDIIELQKDIKTLDQKIDKKLSQKPRPVARKQSPRRSAKPAVHKPNYIEGAYVASIDLWGIRPYAMLKDKDNKWVPLSKGDTYKGWKLNSLSSQQAVFKKGKSTLTLKVKE